MKKSINLVFIAFFCCSIGLVGCGNGKQNTSSDYLYYTNSTQTGLLAKTYMIEGRTDDRKVANVITAIKEQKAKGHREPLLPEKVKLVRYVFKEHQLFLYFNKAYSDMTAVREILTRSLLVKTLTQIESVASVSFYVDGAPLRTADGNQVGMMTKESVSVQSIENRLDKKAEDITLYFSSLNGKKLIKEVRRVSNNNNESEAKLVMRALLAGPSEERAKAKSALPKKTAVNSVTVMSGVAYVDFNKDFLTQNYDVSEKVVIYSIVNSLTSISSVNSVQISVNSNSAITYRTNIKLNQYFTQKLDLVETNSTND